MIIQRKAKEITKAAAAVEDIDRSQSDGPFQNPSQEELQNGKGSSGFWNGGIQHICRATHEMKHLEWPGHQDSALGWDLLRERQGRALVDIFFSEYVGRGCTCVGGVVAPVSGGCV